MITNISRKKILLTIASIAIMAAVVGTAIACPIFTNGQQTLQQQQIQSSTMPANLVLNDSDWKNIDQFLATNAVTNVTSIVATSKGWVFQRIDNETIKQYSLVLNLTLELGQSKNNRASIINVTGTLSIKSTTFNMVHQIESGKGIMIKARHAALIRAKGVDAQNNNVTLTAEADYFWWGGKTFAFRGKAILTSDRNPMLLLLRYGLAKAQ